MHQVWKELNMHFIIQAKGVTHKKYTLIHTLYWVCYRWEDIFTCKDYLKKWHLVCASEILQLYSLAGHTGEELLKDLKMTIEYN